jgi:hypothetical protein
MIYLPLQVEEPPHRVSCQATLASEHPASNRISAAMSKTLMFTSQLNGVGRHLVETNQRRTLNL